MNTQFADLRRLAARWQQEHGRVANDATAANLRRLRILGPLIAALNGLQVVWLLWQTLRHPLSGALAQWNTAQTVINLGCGLLMLAMGTAAQSLRHSHRSVRAQLLIAGFVAVLLLTAILVVSIDQVVTPNITPFYVACVLISLVVYLRPMLAAGVYSSAMLLFIFLIGWFPTDPTQMMLNQLNGFAICVLAWGLSLAHWRKFTMVRLQHEQLEKLQSELQHKHKELERLTRLDGLTGLYNRNTFVELTRRELQRAQRQSSSTTIMLLDLDHFKKVNDTWGHPAGDAVLRHVAALINGSIRSTDLAGRLGGEEFIILLPMTTVEAARKIAEKIRARLEVSPAQWEKQAIPITASIGLSNTSASANRDFDSLYNEADRALYVAKHRGRNQVI